MEMLTECLARAIELGGDSIEIEHKDGREWIFVFKQSTGFGIASVPSDEYESLYKEILKLKK